LKRSSCTRRMLLNLYLAEPQSHVRWNSKRSLIYATRAMRNQPINTKNKITNSTCAYYTLLYFCKLWTIIKSRVGTWNRTHIDISHAADRGFARPSAKTSAKGRIIVTAITITVELRRNNSGRARTDDDRPPRRFLRRLFDSHRAARRVRNDVRPRACACGTYFGGTSPARSKVFCRYAYIRSVSYRSHCSRASNIHVLLSCFSVLENLIWSEATWISLEPNSRNFVATLSALETTLNALK